MLSSHARHDIHTGTWDPDRPCIPCSMHLTIYIHTIICTCHPGIRSTSYTLLNVPCAQSTNGKCGKLSLTESHGACKMLILVGRHVQASAECETYG